MQYFDTAPELVDRKFNRPRREQLERGEVLPLGAQGRRDLQKAEKWVGVWGGVGGEGDRGKRERR